jgi:hypothetical protein
MLLVYADCGSGYYYAVYLTSFELLDRPQCGQQSLAGARWAQGENHVAMGIF